MKLLIQIFQYPSSLFLVFSDSLLVISDGSELADLRFCLSELSDQHKEILFASIQHFTDEFFRMALDSDDVTQQLPLIKILPKFRTLIYFPDKIGIEQLAMDSKQINDRIYWQGKKLKENVGINKAFEFFLSFIELGWKFAPQCIAMLYEYSSDDKIRDTEQAIHYLNIGLQMGDESCHWGLAGIYRYSLENHKKEIECALKYFESNAFQNSEYNPFGTKREKCVCAFIERCLLDKDKISLKRFASIMRFLPIEKQSSIKNEATEYINNELTKDGIDDDLFAHLANMVDTCMIDEELPDFSIMSHKEKIYTKISEEVEKIFICS